MQGIYKEIGRITSKPVNVLIRGETGTGKELIARAIYQHSDRANAAFVAINCAAIPETLLESELFGHEKGAFTGALKQKLGRVEEADGGTIFLDEIADMSRPLQAKLLRFLEDGTFTRVGGTQELRVNVRLLAATNRDIVKAIAEDHFREDLFHRLNVVQIRLPPLRERGDDVLLLAEHFLHSFSISMNKSTRTLSRGARQKLSSHHWPGNVRELRNVIERALILETSGEIQVASLPDFQIEARLHKAGPHKPTGASLDDMMANFERELISELLEQNHFSLARTAEQLKISRHALRYRMQRLNISGAGEAEEESAAPAGTDNTP
jgi:transcriptional regulator with PAS, ATPase and Fis domain